VVNQQGRENDHSLPSGAEVKNGEAVSPLPHISSSAKLVKQRNNFTFT
jgi:hypothetical protein